MALPAFRLQLPVERIVEYAARFPAPDTAGLELGRAARERGFYTRDEFRTVCRWKTPRSGPLVARNGAAEIKAATRVALAVDACEQERIEALRSLRGVGWPTASVLLHLAFPDRYPILDVRALHAFGIDRPLSYRFAVWEAYCDAWREVRAAAGVDGRTLDRGLWQWSKEQAPG